MSLPDRRQFLTLLAALPLAGCGFTPAYAPGGAGDKLRGRVAVEAPRSRYDFAFTARLETRFGPVQTPVYDLGYSLSFTRVSGGISPANEITRYTLKGQVAYTLTERATGTRIAGGKLENFTSWSATGSTVAGISAEDAAEQRLIRILADDIVTRLVAELS
jgi:LPS-assembly lipoprotein